MRIPNSYTDAFSMQLNKLYGSISERYLEAIKKQIETKKVSMMLTDASVTQQDTFDPHNAAMFYEMLSRNLKNWSSQGIEKTDTDDLRRLHVLFTTPIENYSLSCYLGIQYHALLFYKLDNRIKDIQTEIMMLDEKLANIKQEIASKENTILEEEMKKRGIANLSIEEMLALLYNDEKLYYELTRKVDDIEKSKPEYVQMARKRDELVEELKGMIIELYRIMPVLIDHNKLMQGEEGATIYFDLEMVKKGEKIGAIEVEKIPTKIKQTIIDRFREIDLALKEVHV
jgi:hypothetical protein